MSQENVEIVRRGIEAWNRGDMDAFRELHDPDAVLRPVSDWPEQGPFVGRTTLMRLPSSFATPGTPTRLK